MARWQSFVYLELQDTLDSNPNTRNRKKQGRMKGEREEGRREGRIGRYIQYRNQQTRRNTQEK